MLNITQLTIDPQSLGNNFLLVGVAPSYKFENNVKTDMIEGFKYQIALPAHKLEKINVNVLGNPLFDINDKDKLNEQLLEMPAVIFENLKVKIYYTKESGYGVTASADAVRLVCNPSSETMKKEVKINA